MRIVPLFLSLAAFAQAEPLFNGKDLSNWRVDSKSKVEHWTVKDGILHCQSGPQKAGSVRWTNKNFTDFTLTLTLEYKNGEGTIDSGVMLKGKLLGVCFWREGLEAAFGPEQRGVKGG